MYTSHEEPDKDCHPSPPEDGTQAPEREAESGMKYRFYSISITQSGLVCSNRAAYGVREWESKEKTQVACERGLSRTEHLFLA